jgi:hypothetical protein
MYFEQPIIIRDTTESLNYTTGSFLTYGGFTINSTYESSGPTSGAFVVRAGAGVGGKLNVAGITRIYNTADSTASNNGAFVVDGGVGVAKDLNVGGNTTIFGNLYVAGTTTQVNTQTLLVEDNTLVINSGPAGSRDAGLLIHRDGTDVIADGSVTTGSLSAIAQTSFTLGGSFTGNYSGWWLRTSDGSAQISTYNGTTGSFFTGGSTLGATPTELTFDVFNRSYLGQYYDESADELRFAYIADATDPKIDLDNLNNYANVRFNTLYANTSVSTANLIVTNSATIASLALSSANLDYATIGTLYVTGASTLHGGISSGGLYISGGSILNLGITTGSINSTGASVLHQGVSTGGLYVSGGSILNLGITTGSINSTGASILHGGITTGSINSTGASILHGGITAGTLYVSAGAIIDIGLTSGSLNISGSSVLHSTTTIGGLAVTGASYFADDVLITGGNLTVTSGSIVFNTVDVSPSMADIIKERAATIGNNVVSATNLLAFSFDNAVARVFDAVVSVTINGTSGNKYAYYNLKGVQKDTGNWVLNSSFVGDITGLTFSITSGQLQYTTTNKLDFTDGTVKFRALTTTV